MTFGPYPQRHRDAKLGLESKIVHVLTSPVKFGSADPEESISMGPEFQPAMKIGVVAPPWVPVPPTKYGGTELVLDVLCRGLKKLGHHVILFTTADSTCDVETRWLFPRADPDRMGAAVLELRHAAAAYDEFHDLDIVHDHTLVGPFLGASRRGRPIVTTNHGPFNGDLADLYRRMTSDAPLIAISHDQAGRAPADIPISAVIHHGLDLDRYEFSHEPGDYLVTLGRMNPDKGIDLAIDIARRTDTKLFIAAKMREQGEFRYFKSNIEPKLGNGIEYVGEVDHPTKLELLNGALALLNPIRWPEPFGLVMTESLACGTPVVATTEGAAPEIVDHGTTGYLHNTIDGMIEGVRRAAEIDRTACRQTVEERFSMARMARDHERFYRSVLTNAIKCHVDGDRRGTLAAMSRPKAVAAAGMIRG